MPNGITEGIMPVAKSGWEAFSSVFPVAAEIAITPIAQPSFWQSLWGGITQPFVSTAQQLIKETPTITGAVSQGIHDILITKYLKPKSEPMGPQSKVIYYEKPQAGNAPPTTTVVVPPTGTALASMLPQNVSQMSPWLIVAPLALIAFLLMRKK
jgi:hypothetical protein